MNTEKRIAQAFSPIGITQYVLAADKIINILSKYKQMYRSHILSLYGADIDLHMFNIAIWILRKSKCIETNWINNDMVITFLGDNIRKKT